MSARKRFEDAFNVATGRNVSVSPQSLNESVQKLEAMEIELASLTVAYDAIRTKGPGIMIPEPTGAGWGARFGEWIDDIGRSFASTREPVGVRVTSHIATDIFDNWLVVTDAKGEKGDKELDDKVQKVIEQFKVKQQLIRACDFERTYGTSIIIFGYDDQADAKKLREPLPENRGSMDIVQLYAYSKPRITQIWKETDIKQPRLGQPKVYEINQNLAQNVSYHWTRIEHCATRLRDHPFFGESALDPIWDDMTVYRNVRWGVGQTMFRVGGGVPVIKLKGTPVEVAAWQAQGRFKNLHQRTYMVMGLEESFTFAGAQGTALNPKEYIEASVESISIGSNIPKVQLRGAQAGSLSGSETNLKEYFGFISSLQTLWNPTVKAVIQRFIDTGQIETEAEDFILTWNPSFKMSEIDLARIGFQNTMANKNRLSYMTIDEVRALDKLLPMENDNGKVCPGLLELQAKLIRQATPLFPTGQETTRGDITTTPQFPQVMLEDKIVALQIKVISGEIDREKAIELVKGYILEHQQVTERAAIDALTARTGRTITRLPEESKAFYEAQSDTYMRYFIKLLDDWLKVGGHVE